MRPFIFLIGLLPLFLSAEPLVFESHSGQVSVVELYTSQGCSSCPPADHWLSRLVDHPDLWKHIIPLAFHVDYWNYLGWADPFADAGNSRRQRRYRRLGHTGSVYTPGFVVNGREWRGWWGQKSLPSDRLAGATLHARWQDGELEVSYGKPAEDQQLHLALLGFDLVTAVRRGENRHRQLREDFVVLRHRQVPSDNAHWRIRWRDDPRLAPRRALVLWVSEGDDPSPLQAAAGWLH